MKPAALITGGARGIGFGIAEALAREGFDLFLCGRREPASVKDAVDRLEELGADVGYLSVDIADPETPRRLTEAVREKFGRLDCLVNNAGVAPRERKDLLDASRDSFDWVMDINLRGPYFLTQSVARWMVDQKHGDASFRGSIVFVTSISSTVASTNRGEYCISKAGLTMAVKLWAVRLAEFGLPVYEVRPGIIWTDMTKGVQEKYDRLIEEGLMLQPRWGEPEDVGKAVAMLARGDLPYSTGQVVMVDGGMMLDRL